MLWNTIHTGLLEGLAENCKMTTQRETFEEMKTERGKQSEQAQDPSRRWA